MENVDTHIARLADNARIAQGGPAVMVDDQGNRRYFKARVLANGELELLREIDPNKSGDGISRYFITCDSDTEDEEK